MTDDAIPVVNVADLRDALEKWIAENDEVRNFEFKHVEFGGLTDTRDLEIEEDQERVVFSAEGLETLTVQDVLDRLEAFEPAHDDDDESMPEVADIDLFRVFHVEFGGLTRSCLIELVSDKGFVVLS